LRGQHRIRTCFPFNPPRWKRVRAPGIECARAAYGIDAPQRTPPIVGAGDGLLNSGRRRPRRRGQLF